MAVSTKARTGGKRLAAVDWVNAAVRCMLRSSVDGVRVERLAKDLKVTKGSFYWHFRDRNALLKAVVQRWEEMTVNFNRLLISEEPDPAHRLLRFFHLPEEVKAAVPPADFDLAFRAWARRDERVRRATEKVDVLRAQLLLKTFHELGVTGARAVALSTVAGAVGSRLWALQTLSAKKRHDIIREIYTMLLEAIPYRNRARALRYLKSEEFAD